MNLAWMDFSQSGGLDVSIRSNSSLLALTAALALGVTACGGGDAVDTVQDAVSELSSAAAEASPMTSAEAEEMVSEAVEDISDMASSLEEMQSGGSASITVGDETWAFDGVLCAFGAEETGQEGAEFNLSAIADGLQFYISIDEYGHTVSLNDIANFENPTVSWESDMSADGFITVNGKEASGEVGFVDFDSNTMDPVPGTFEATCP